MSNGLNVCHFVGNIGRDPEMHEFASGTKNAKFSLAVNERFKSGDEWQERVVWVDCVAWGKTAGVVERFCHKGKQVFVTVRFSVREWEGRDGQKRRKPEFTVDRLLLLGGKSEPRDLETTVNDGPVVPDGLPASNGPDDPDLAPF